jgi:hypothetical protein
VRSEKDVAVAGSHRAIPQPDMQNPSLCGLSPMCLESRAPGPSLSSLLETCFNEGHNVNSIFAYWKDLILTKFEYSGDHFLDLMGLLSFTILT